jgi:hypothetical protein
MAVEQLPASQYAVGQSLSLAGYEIMQSVFGWREDSENKAAKSGEHKAKLTYSRRRTLDLELEALAAATPATYVAGGAVDTDLVPTAVADDMAWKIVSANDTQTRGVEGVSLSLIALTDLITHA